MIDITCTKESIEWYKKFNIHQKIQIKAYCHLICGMKWVDFNILFSPKERIQILYEKISNYIKI